jgi:hypothetical protein
MMHCFFHKVSEPFEGHPSFPDDVGVGAHPDSSFVEIGVDCMPRPLLRFTLRID